MFSCSCYPSHGCTLPLTVCDCTFIRCTTYGATVTTQSSLKHISMSVRVTGSYAPFLVFPSKNACWSCKWICNIAGQTIQADKCCLMPGDRHNCRIVECIHVAWNAIGNWSWQWPMHSVLDIRNHWVVCVTHVFIDAKFTSLVTANEGHFSK